MRETIIGVAVRIEEAMYVTLHGGPVVITAVKPYRHNEALHRACVYLNVDSILGIKNTQGFVTSTGRFVTREEAFSLAHAAGQLLHPCERYTGVGKLFSEDVW